MDAVEGSSSSSPIPMLPAFPSTSDPLAMPLFEEEMDIFKAQLASVFDIATPTIPTGNETEPLVLVDSLFEIIKSSSGVETISLLQVDMALGWSY